MRSHLSILIVATIGVDLLDVAVLLRNPAASARWQCRSPVLRQGRSFILCSSHRARPFWCGWPFFMLWWCAPRDRSPV